jgi:HK97 gp10 family phage protein
MENKKNFDKAKDKLNEAIKKALDEIGSFVVAEAQLRTPVDTSNLRRSETFRTDNSKNTVYVGSNVEYDQYVEQGTSKQKAQPHWTPAVYDNIENINNIVEKHLKEVGE